MLVCDGAIFCIRRALFRPLSPDLANDLELPLRIGEAGYWTCYEPGAMVAESETTSPREELARRRRIVAQGALGMWRLRGALRGRRGWQFVSRKLLRWLTLLPLAMTLVSSAWLANLPRFGLLLSAQVAFYACGLIGFALAALGRHPGRLFALPFFILLGSAGALAGLVDACLGRRFDIWEIAALSRGVAQRKA